MSKTPRKYYTVAVFHVRGIKCDTVGCNWHDDDVSVNDYQIWLNKPCPVCSGNLLTQKDFDTVVRTIVISKKLDRWCNKWLPEFLLRRLDAGETNHKFDMDGSGKIKVKK